MASENETVAEVCRRRLRAIEDTFGNTATIFNDIADEIEAAHRREIAEKNGERNGIIKANESLAVDNTRLRGEVAELREDVVRTSKRVDCQKVVIIDLRRRLRVAEDALKLCISGMCGECSRQHPGKTCVNGCYEMTAAKNALDAIREKTKTKGE